MNIQTHTGAGYTLAERWDDDVAILQNVQTGSYELWHVTVGADDTLVIDAPNDGRDYVFVREVSEFELDDDEVTSSALIV